ncbi:hypothetical protein MJN54_32865, partial [Salmonella enterica subsp. enterica serovar Kentucky]|nr:hypothetical protein [Salmonella enterica subsp. enterica serovar Kentucky]
CAIAPTIPHIVLFPDYGITPCVVADLYARRCGRPEPCREWGYAKIYRFPVSQSIDELMEACREVIRKNNLTSAYIRPLVFVGDV